MHKKFAIFILTHGRPDRVVTLKTIKATDYAGDIYLVCDDEDEALQEYKERYGSMVRVFCKEEWLRRSDTMDNLIEPRSVILAARNYCFELATQLGLDAFLELDDDYTEIAIKRQQGSKFTETRVKKGFNRICEEYITLLNTHEWILSVCFAQGGDYIGGPQNANICKHGWWLPKGMNAFFCSTKKPFSFIGRINEDVNTYVTAPKRGEMLITLADVLIKQGRTQSNAGGMTDTYNYGTYTKSMYTVLCAPSAVQVRTIGTSHPRLHHHIKWNAVAPKIISDRHRRRAQ